MEHITRGTTPTVIWHIPEGALNFDMIDNAHVIFYSLTNKVTKDMRDIEMDAEHRYIYVYLSQEETLQFSECRVSVQLRVHLNDGQALATSIRFVTINPILEEQVMEAYE